MKKIKILTTSVLSIAVIAGMGVGLTSCVTDGESTTSGGDSTTSSTVEVNNIVIARETPTYVAVGETIDYAEYISTTPEGAPITITSDSENITIDGTKVTGVGLGDYTIMIHAGSKQRGWPGKVVSTEKAYVIDYLSTLGNNYSGYMYGYDPSDLSRPYVFSDVLHNENYSVDYRYNTAKADIVVKMGDEATPKTYSGTYEGYTQDAKTGVVDGTTGTVTLNPGITSNYDFTLYGTKITAKEADFEDVVDEEGNPVGISVSEELVDSVYTAQGINYAYWQSAFSQLLGQKLEAVYQVIPLLNADFPEDQVPTKDDYVGVSFATLLPIFEGNQYGVAVQLQLTDKGTSNIEVIDKVVEDQIEPTPLKFDAFDTKMAGLLEGKNYTIEGHLNIGYYNKTTWVDADATGLAGIKEQWGIAPAKTIAYVNGENYLAYSGLTGEVSYEYYHKDGEVLYGQAGKYNHDTKAYTVTNADTQLGIDSIWLPGIQIDGYMAPITVADFTPEALKAISYQSVEGENASATSPGDQGHLTLLTMALIPSIGYGTSAMFSTLYSTANAQMKFYDFFNNTTVKVTADTIELETSISGLGYDSKGELLDAYMGIKISAIGSTTVPTVTTGTAAEVGE